jgi:glycosyltransferase involved in cell wall biosynthesis
MTPKLSIITINYNNLEGLHRSFQSVFNQSYKPVEFIIIDGGSVDGSLDLIEKHTDKIDYWVSEPDNGIYNAMNKGIKAAKGEYLFFLNSGDEFYDEEVIEKFQHYFEEKSTCLCGNIVFFEGNKEISTKKHPAQMTFKYATSRIISHQATFIRSEAFKKYGLYNEQNKIVSDSEFFFKLIALNGESYQYIDVNIAKFYFGGVSGNVALGHQERDNYLRKMLPYIYNNDYDTYVFNLFRETNSRVNYIRNIESNKMLRKLTTVILAIFSMISKLLK